MIAPSLLPAALLLPGATSEDGGYAPPTIGEFFPGALFFANTPFAITRINLVMMLMAGLLCLLMVVAFRKPALVPRGIQNLGELMVDFVYRSIVEEILGAAGRRFAGFLVGLFFFILFFNIAGILPLLHISPSSVIAVPLLMAVTVWVVFNVVGIRTHGLVHYVSMNIFPPGVPKPIYLFITPIEFVSTFLLRPVTLTIRLLANMMSGHLLLVLFFSATWFFLLESDGILKVFALPSFLMGFVFTLFEILVAVLQAYIFSLLAAVYIQGSLSEEH